MDSASFPAHACTRTDVSPSLIVRLFFMQLARTCNTNMLAPYKTVFDSVYCVVCERAQSVAPQSTQMLAVPMRLIQEAVQSARPALMLFALMVPSENARIHLYVLGCASSHWDQWALASTHRPLIREQANGLPEPEEHKCVLVGHLKRDALELEHLLCAIHYEQASAQASAPAQKAKRRAPVVAEPAQDQDQEQRPPMVYVIQERESTQELTYMPNVEAYIQERFVLLYDASKNNCMSDKTAFDVLCRIEKDHAHEAHVAHHIMCLAAAMDDDMCDFYERAESTVARLLYDASDQREHERCFTGNGLLWDARECRTEYANDSGAMFQQRVRDRVHARIERIRERLGWDEGEATAMLDGRLVLNERVFELCKKTRVALAAIMHELQDGERSE